MKVATPTEFFVKAGLEKVTAGQLVEILERAMQENADPSLDRDEFIATAASVADSVLSEIGVHLVGRYKARTEHPKHPEHPAHPEHPKDTDELPVDSDS